jgi:hypothetical protein
MAVDAIHHYEEYHLYQSFDPKKFPRGQIVRKKFDGGRSSMNHCLGVRGHFQAMEVTSESGVSYEIHCNHCDWIEAKTLCPSRLAIHAGTCITAKNKVNAQHIDMLNKINFFFVLFPEKREMIGTTKTIKGKTTTVLVFPNGRGMYSKKYEGLMEEDEFDELCAEFGENPNVDGRKDMIVPKVWGKIYGAVYNVLNGVTMATSVLYEGLKDLGYPMDSVKLKYPAIQDKQDEDAFVGKVEENALVGYSSEKEEDDKKPAAITLADDSPAVDFYADSTRLDAIMYAAHVDADTTWMGGNVGLQDLSPLNIPAAASMPSHIETPQRNESPQREDSYQQFLRNMFESI